MPVSTAAIPQQDTMGNLTKLLGLIQGVKGTSGSTTTSSNISAQGMQGLINQILGGPQGLGAVAAGQKSAGLYNSTTNQLLTNDLVTQASQKLASAQAGTTTKTQSNPLFSGQSLLQLAAIFGGQKLLGPVVKKGVSKLGLDDTGDKLSDLIFGTDNNINAAGSLNSSVAGVGSETANELGAYGGSLSFADVMSTGTGLDLSSTGAGAGIAGAGITSATIAPELEASIGAYAGTATAADVGATAAGIDIAGSTAATGTAVEGAGIFDAIVPWLTSLFSDERLKTDVKQVGETNQGQPIYTYKYIDNPITTHMGVMAQETLKFHPEAVSKHSSGALMVDYDKILGVD